MTKIERGKVAITCPECKEKSAGKLKYYAESNQSHEHYYCPLCKEHWDPSELLKEEYKTAVFKGDDGEWKFLKIKSGSHLSGKDLFVINYSKL